MRSVHYWLREHWTGVGIIAPAATVPAFVVLSLGWLWMGWKYAVARDRAVTLRVESTSLGCIPDGCDFELAKREIEDLFAVARREATSEGKHVALRTEAATAWPAFAANPNRMTAVALVAAMPPAQKYFVACSPGGRVYETEQVLRRHR